MLRVKIRKSGEGLVVVLYLLVEVVRRENLFVVQHGLRGSGGGGAIVDYF